MKPDMRTEIVDGLQLAEDEILVTKAKEYANDEDTLANFKIIAEVLNVAMPFDHSAVTQSLYNALDVVRTLRGSVPPGGSVSNQALRAMNYIEIAIEDWENYQQEWTPEHVLAVYWLKHILAALDNMNRGDTLSEGLESRILDARVYAACALCLAMDK